MKILIIDDDIELLELLEEYLSNNGIEVKTASSGKMGLSMIGENEFSLAILDVMMPEMSGLDVLKVINTDYIHLPVIMLTAKGDEIDRVVGLEMGADDYIVKPFSPRELLARIKAIIRREEKTSKKLRKGKKILSSEIIKLDLKKRHACVNGNLVDLSSLEFDLLSVLVENRGIVLSREKLMDLARGKEFMAYDRSIDVAISRIRQKIEKDPQNPDIIKTVWGVGYVFTGS